MRRQTAWLLLLAFLFCGISVSFAESATYTPGMSLKETMEIVQNTHPTELDLGKVKWTPSQLAELKSMMADPSGLRFQAVFCKTDYTESTEEIDLNGSSVKISQEELLAACPKVSKAHVDLLASIGALGGMPETSQISLF